jgi:hypothetical protein
MTDERDGDTNTGQDPARAGKCYSSAFEALILLGETRGYLTPGDQYVLGTIITDGKARREPHAWVESGDVVYDLTVTSKPWDRANFYRIASAIAIERYGADTVMAIGWPDLVTTILQPFHAKHMPPKATSS